MLAGSALSFSVWMLSAWGCVYIYFMYSTTAPGFLRRICKSGCILTRRCTGLISIDETMVLDSQSLHSYLATSINAQFIKTNANIKVKTSIWLSRVCVGRVPPRASDKPFLTRRQCREYFAFFLKAKATILYLLFVSTNTLERGCGIFFSGYDNLS